MAKAPKQAAEEETMDVAPKKGRKKLFIIIAAVMLLAVVAVVQSYISFRRKNRNMAALQKRKVRPQNRTKKKCRLHLSSWVHLQQT